MEKISLIIPVYNCEEYVEECIKSAKKQKSAEFGLEIIIVNDGSRDNSEAIISPLLDDCCKYVVQENQGLSGARNTGISCSTGDFLFFLDSDDYLPENALLNMYRAIVNSGDDVVIGKMICFNSTERKDYYFNKWIKNCSHVTYLDEKQLLNIISACGKLYRKSAIADLRFLPRLTHEDNYFSLSLYNKKLKYTLIDEAVYARRIREGSSKSITQGLGMKTYRDLLTNYYKFLESNQIDNVFNYSLSKKTTRYIARFIDPNDFKEAVKLQNEFWKYLDANTLSINKLTIRLYRMLCIFEMRIFSAIRVWKL